MSDSKPKLITILFIYLTINARDFSKEGTKEAILLRFTITSKGSIKKDLENPPWELAMMCSILDCYWDASQISVWPYSWGSQPDGWPHKHKNWQTACPERQKDMPNFQACAYTHTHTHTPMRGCTQSRKQ